MRADRATRSRPVARLPAEHGPANAVDQVEVAIEASQLRIEPVPRVYCGIPQAGSELHETLDGRRGRAVSEHQDEDGDDGTEANETKAPGGFHTAPLDDC